MGRTGSHVRTVRNLGQVRIVFANIVYFSQECIMHMPILYISKQHQMALILNQGNVFLVLYYLYITFYYVTPHIVTHATVLEKLLDFDHE